MVVTERKSPNGFFSFNFRYNKEYEKYVELKDGTIVLLRHLVPCDTKKLLDWFGSFSDSTIFFRYFNVSPSFMEREQKRLLNALNKGKLILVAELLKGSKALVGISELFIQKDNPQCAECAITVADTWQKKYLGTQMLEWLVELAKMRGIAVLMGYYSTMNRYVSTILKKSGYEYITSHEQDIISFKLYLDNRKEGARAGQ